MTRKSHYFGGSTLIGPRNLSWFSFKAPKWARKKSAQKPPTKGKSTAKKRRMKPAKSAKKRFPPKPTRKLPAIKPEPSVPHREVTEVRQTGLRGKRGKTVAVEFSTKRKSSGIAVGAPRVIMTKEKLSVSSKSSRASTSTPGPVSGPRR